MPVHRLLIATLMIAGVVFGGVAVACSGRSGGGTPSATVARVPKSTGGTQGGPDLSVPGPASRYAPATKELPGLYTVNVPETFTQNISTFASSYLFDTAQQGNDLARQWQIIDGYKVDFEPDGLAAGVLKGEYYVSIEIYEFNGISGAQAAYAYIKNRLASTAGSQVISAKGLGNESSAFQFVQGTVSASTMVGIYHRFLFRRGNIVASVQTFGGKPFMTIDAARNIAIIIDNRILGKTEATIPTPIPTPAINIATPSASPSSGAGS